MDPKKCIPAQARLMAYLLDKYDGSADKALAGYNSGEGGVQRATAAARASGRNWQDHVPDETKGYLGRITKLYGTYASAMNNASFQNSAGVAAAEPPSQGYLANILPQGAPNFAQAAGAMPSEIAKAFDGVQGDGLSPKNNGYARRSGVIYKRMSESEINALPFGQALRVEDNRVFNQYAGKPTGEHASVGEAKPMFPNGRSPDGRLYVTVFADNHPPEPGNPRVHWGGEVFVQVWPAPGSNLNQSLQAAKTEVTASNVAIAGDSLAEGYRDAAPGVLGAKTASEALVSQNPKTVLGFVEKMGREGRMRENLILSTGASNGVSQIEEYVPKQIAAARAGGAKNIVIIGVGDRDDIKGANPALERIAREQGVLFSGPLVGLDGGHVHPTPQNYPVNLQVAIAKLRGIAVAAPVASEPAVSAPVASVAPYGASPYAAVPNNNASGARIASPLPPGSVMDTHGFGEARPGHMHVGTDLVAAKDTPVSAIGSGVICGDTDGPDGGASGFGRMIKVCHGGGIASIYAHLDRDAMPRPGSLLNRPVRPGDVIGYVGKTGNAAQPGMPYHLHLEVRHNNQPINPAPYLSLAGVRQFRNYAVRFNSPNQS